MHPPGYRFGLVAVTGSAVAWSMAGLFTRLIHLDSWTMLVWRGVFGALGLAAVIIVMQRGQAGRAFRNMGWQGWLFALVSAIGMIFFISALRHTTVAHVAVIYAAVPFVAAALGWMFLRERPSMSALLASLAALIGVAAMVGLGVEGGWFGDLLAGGMTVCVAAMMIIARKYRAIPVMQAACLSALLSALVCWPLSDPGAITGSDLGLLALFGLVNSALGLALFTLGAKFLPAIETALIGALDAPLAPLWVWLVFNETPSRGTLIGGMIVFAAVALHLFAGTRRLTAPARSASPDRHCRRTG